MKKLLLALSLGILLSACVTGGVAPIEYSPGSCAQGYYWSTSAQSCVQRIYGG
jgi:hypothetical protein